MFVIWCLHTNKRRPCSSTLSGHPSSSFDFHFAVPVLVPCRNPMTVPRFSPGSIPPRSVPSRCELLLLPLLAELVRYCLCALSNTHLCETTRLPHPPSTLHTELASLACARCFGEQLCGFAAALTNNCFEERWLWGVAASNFGKQLLETTLGGSPSSFGEQLLGAAFDNNFGERLCGTALWSRFGEQLWGAALGSRSSFEEQLCTAALKNRSFGE